SFARNCNYSYCSFNTPFWEKGERWGLPAPQAGFPRPRQGRTPGPPFPSRSPDAALTVPLNPSATKQGIVCGLLFRGLFIAALSPACYLITEHDFYRKLAVV